MKNNLKKCEKAIISLTKYDTNDILFINPIKIL